MIASLRTLRRGTAGFLLLLAASPVSAQEALAPTAPAEDAPAAESLEQLPYTVTLIGASGEVETVIREASRLITLQDRPPASLTALDRRIDDDRNIVRDALRSLGYYAGTVAITADDQVRPVRVTITVEPGQPFLLTAFRIRSARPDTSKPPVEVPLEEIGIELGRPAHTADILAAETKLIAAFARRAYPLAEILDRRVEVDHATNRVSVDILLDTGAFARFGQADIRGLADVEAEFVRKRLPGEVGTPFDLGRLEEARKRLIESNLFSSIRLTPADRLDPDGLLLVVVELTERPHRTVGGTLSWNTNEGFGIEAYWEHRNLLSAGEKLRLGSFFNQLGYGAEAAYRNPDYWGRDWDLITDLKLEDLETEAFATTSASASFGADLRLTDLWRVRAVGAAEYSIETEDGRERRFTLLSTPVEAMRDSTDDLLDPTTGGRLSLRFTPYYSLSGDSDHFLRFDIADSIYYLMLEEPRVILAGWADIGTILGGSLNGIPAQKRFYAGGGGSIRAYGYQMAGPLEPDGDPRGGLSLLAFGGEARVNVTPEIGIVPFLEAGTVYDARYPDFSEDLRWGAGLGLRYYTGIGPIRADIAFPLNPRDADDPFQIYLSFGQAF